MDDSMLSSKELRTLYKMRNRKSVPESEIYNCRDLYALGFIAPNYHRERDPLGVAIPDGTYRLTAKYWRLSAVRRETWIWRFVPIAISAAALVVSIIALLRQ